jgi:tetratricopeptide (TPR) repeat protein
MAYGQDYRQEADKCLTDGDYKCAIKNLQLYQEETGADVSRQIQDAETCMTTRVLADDAFEEKNYEKAMQQYEKILKLNPMDTYTQKRMENLRSMNPDYADAQNKLGGQTKRDTVAIQAPTSQSTAVVSLPLQPIQIDPNVVLSKEEKKALKVADKAYAAYAKKRTAMSKSTMHVVDLDDANASKKKVAKAVKERNKLIEETQKLEYIAKGKQDAFRMAQSKPAPSFVIQATTSQSTAVVSLPLQPIQKDPNTVLSKKEKKALKEANKAYAAYAKKLSAMSKSIVHIVDLYDANASRKKIANAVKERDNLIKETQKLKDIAKGKQDAFYMAQSKRKLIN